LINLRVSLHYQLALGLASHEAFVGHVQTILADAKSIYHQLVASNSFFFDKGLTLLL
jgi:hypothetical protein